jgi:hypothetical protein
MLSDHLDPFSAYPEADFVLEIEVLFQRGYFGCALISIYIKTYFNDLK